MRQFNLINLSESYCTLGDSVAFAKRKIMKIILPANTNKNVLLRKMSFASNRASCQVFFSFCKIEKLRVISGKRREVF